MGINSYWEYLVIACKSNEKTKKETRQKFEGKSNRLKRLIDYYDTKDGRKIQSSTTDILTPKTSHT